MSSRSVPAPLCSPVLHPRPHFLTHANGVSLPILQVFAQRNPRYLLRIVNHHDSLFALCMWFVERHYLSTYGGSFAETFYGLKRRRTLNRALATTAGGSASEERTKAAFDLTGKSDKLGAKEINGSLVFLVSPPPPVPFPHALKACRIT